jgi:hypothetical protein
MVNDWYKEAQDHVRRNNMPKLRKFWMPVYFLGAKLSDTYNEALYHYEVALIEEAQSQYAQALPGMKRLLKNLKLPEASMAKALHGIIWPWLILK